MTNLLTIGVICMISVAFLSMIASMATLMLIRLLRKWNGYIQLVTSLTVCQAIYDCAFLLLLFNKYQTGRVLYEVIHTFSGLASTLW